jgi:hypothetical protein
MLLVYQTIAGIDMNPKSTITEPFARCIAISKRVEWDINADVIRGRTFDMAHKFLPDGLTLAPSYLSSQSMNGDTSEADPEWYRNGLWSHFNELG